MKAWVGLPPMTTEPDEVQVACAMAAFESPRHGFTAVLVILIDGDDPLDSEAPRLNQLQAGCLDSAADTGFVRPTTGSDPAPPAIHKSLMYDVAVVRLSMFPQDRSLQPTVQKKRRVGCLGCLGQLALIFTLGAILVLAMTGVFYPWAFYLGGTFHILPYWQGLGKLHAKSGDYLLFVRMEPTPRGSRMYLETNLTGIAYLCTPQGERFRMSLGGGMRKHLNLSTDGEAIHLYMNNRPWNWQFITDRRPHLDLRGHWQNTYLVMDDHGSISNAFQPDGSVYRDHDPNRPYSTEGVPVTFVPASYSDFDSACAAVYR